MKVSEMTTSPQFSFEDIAFACKAATERLRQNLEEPVLSRLKLGKVPHRHGTDTRVFLYHIWDKHQPTLLDKRHFGYNFVYDPTLQYLREPLVVNFYANRHRIYDKKETVIPALWMEMLEATKELAGFEASGTAQMINLFRHFAARDVDDLAVKISKGFLDLIGYWHPRYAAVVDNYGCRLSREEVEATIAGRKKFQPSGPTGGSEQQYSEINTREAAGYGTSSRWGQMPEVRFYPRPPCRPHHSCFAWRANRIGESAGPLRCP